MAHFKNLGLLATACASFWKPPATARNLIVLHGHGDARLRGRNVTTLSVVAQRRRSAMKLCICSAWMRSAACRARVSPAFHLLRPLMPPPSTAPAIHRLALFPPPPPPPRGRAWALPKPRRCAVGHDDPRSATDLLPCQRCKSRAPMASPGGSLVIFTPVISTGAGFDFGRGGLSA